MSETVLQQKTAPKHQPKKPQTSSSQEESSKIQWLGNTLSQALKQSMAVSTETESKGNVQALHVGKNFKTWLLKFLHKLIAGGPIRGIKGMSPGSATLSPPETTSQLAMWRLIPGYLPKLGEANRFHLQREGPFEIAECVMDITYRVRKVGGHSKRDPQAVHFNNLWLYKERQEESMEDAPQGG
ncbi:unnamed protein product, partial [Porites evermanni]